MSQTHAPLESLFEHDLSSLTTACEAMALPRRTGGQVLKWVYEKGIVDFAQMSDLSKDARAKLSERFCGLLEHPKTQERIMGMLSTGKPVRN